MKRASIPSIALVAAVLVACGGDPAPEEPVAVVVNGEAITEGDVAEELARLPKALQERYGDPAQRPALLDRMVDRRLLLQAARARGLHEDPAILEKVADLEERLLVDALHRAIAAEAVSDARVKGYYDANRAEYTQEQVRVRHILVADAALAESLRRQLVEGADFPTLAREHSVDPTARRGGELGYIQRGRMDPAFERAAFALTEPGQISPVVRTRFGHHVIQLVEPAASRVREFEQVKLTIEQKLRREAVEAFLAEARASATIEPAIAPEG